MDVTIADEPGSERFVIRADGADVGEITYTERHGRRILVHTGVDEAFEGQGIAGRAAAALLDEMRARGELIVPLCPYLHRYIERHPEYDDLVDHELLRAYERPAEE
jgi:predicted GNAT family acetyltransferase